MTRVIKRRERGVPSDGDSDPVALKAIIAIKDNTIAVMQDQISCLHQQLAAQKVRLAAYDKLKETAHHFGFMSIAFAIAAAKTCKDNHHGQTEVQTTRPK